MAFKMKGHPLKRGLYMGAKTPYKDYSVEKGSHDHPHSPAKKTTYMLKKGGKKVKVSKAEYEKALGGKAGSKINK
jgi:hypothetical protein